MNSLAGRRVRALPALIAVPHEGQNLAHRILMQREHFRGAHALIESRAAQFPGAPQTGFVRFRAFSRVALSNPGQQSLRIGAEDFRAGLYSRHRCHTVVWTLRHGRSIGEMPQFRPMYSPEYKAFTYLSQRRISSVWVRWSKCKRFNTSG